MLRVGITQSFNINLEAVNFKEPVELGVVRQPLIPEAAKVDESGVSLKEADKGGNGFKAFQ